MLRSFSLVKRSPLAAQRFVSQSRMFSAEKVVNHTVKDAAYYEGPYYTEPPISATHHWTNPAAELYKGHYQKTWDKPLHEEDEIMDEWAPDDKKTHFSAGEALVILLGVFGGIFSLRQIVASSGVTPTNLEVHVTDRRARPITEAASAALDKDMLQWIKTVEGASWLETEKGKEWRRNRKDLFQ